MVGNALIANIYRSILTLLVLWSLFLLPALPAVQAQEEDVPPLDPAIEQLYENALLLEGLHPNPAAMVPRLQRLIERAAAALAE